MQQISLERAQQIIGNIVHEMDKADIDVQDIKVEVSTEEEFLSTIDTLTTILANEIWGNITEKDYFDVLEIESGISKEEIDYLSELKVLNKPKFKEEV